MSETSDDVPVEPEFGGSTRLFPIPEPDLIEMERIIPSLCMRFMEHLDPKTRVQFERLKRILSDVRWEGGPPSEVMRIDA